MEDKHNNQKSGFTLDASMLNRLRQLDDETMRRMIMQIAAAAGVGEQQAAKATGNVERLRQNLSGLSPKDLQTLLNRIDPKVTENIIQQLKTGGLL